MIYHITSQRAWKKAKISGTYLPEAFDKDGFIHCSTSNQVADVGNRLYVGQVGLMILAINPDKLTAKVVYENLIDGQELFPHIYGPLPITAVESTKEFMQDTTGKFYFPETWLPAEH
jgi:uncharacterized protein (DUF952 family)